MSDSPARNPKGLVSKVLDYVLGVSTFLVPVFVCFSIYYQIGHYVCSTHSAVTGSVTDVVLNQGKHHVTVASVEYPSPDNSTCFVKTWFRRADQGIYAGATIRVVPSLTSRCGNPWFPDHIPPTGEPLWLAAGCAVLAASISLSRRARHKLSAVGDAS